MSLMLLVAAMVLAAAVAGAGFAPQVVDVLKSSKNLYVATERADGSLSKVSPIWFMYDGEAVYFTTVPDSWKAKRVRRGRPLHVWVGSADGPHFVAPGEVLTDPAVAERMAPVYDQKYWISWLGFFRPRPDRVRDGKTVIIRVRPPA
jgi:hypothetical protein